MRFDRRIMLVAPMMLAGCGINSVPTAEEAVKAKWANVQADYQRRADLIPNLVATVKGFAKQEEKVLTQVTQARASATQTVLSADDLTDPAKVKAFQQAQGAVTSALISLRNITEAYPDLKSNNNFMALQSQIEGTENRIRTFPDMVGAKLIYGAKPMTPFVATAPNADRAPTVDFN